MLYFKTKYTGVRVWYGGDCDTDLIEMTQKELDKMWEHWVDVGNLPYRREWDDFHSTNCFQTPDRNCPRCKVKLIRNGCRGTSFAAMHCEYCNFREDTRDAGETWKGPFHEEV